MFYGIRSDCLYRISAGLLSACAIIIVFIGTASAEDSASVERSPGESESGQDSSAANDEPKGNTPADESETDPPLLDEVVVTGKRAPESSFKSDRSISTVDSKKLTEQNPRTTPEALWDAPGVFVQHTNMGGGSPILRGMVGPQVLILVDGVRFSNAVYRTGPVQYLNLIDPLSIDRIEVLRGPGSVLYGSDAMGGVIQVFTQEAGDFRKSEGFDGDCAALMSYSTANKGRTLHGDVDLGYGGFAMLGGVSYKIFDNLQAGHSFHAQPFSGYDNISAIGKMTYRFSNGFFSDWRISAGYLISRIDDAGRTDKLYDSNSLQIYDNTDHLFYSRAHMVFPSIHTLRSIPEINHNRCISCRINIDSILMIKRRFIIKIVKYFSSITTLMCI